ncbi:MAG: hypothetical protein MZV65_18140 [Chromatiales bacterium]|nr:hypothetical protein [Chromatiales bacterium]
MTVRHRRSPHPARSQPAQIFVAVSWRRPSYTYAEATCQPAAGRLDRRPRAGAFAFFSGVPRAAGARQHSRRGITKACCLRARHQPQLPGDGRSTTAWRCFRRGSENPATRPRSKAGVLVVERWIMAALAPPATSSVSRNSTAAIAAAARATSTATPFQRLPGTRRARLRRSIAPRPDAPCRPTRYAVRRLEAATRRHRLSRRSLNGHYLLGALPAGARQPVDVRSSPPAPWKSSTRGERVASHVRAVEPPGQAHHRGRPPGAESHQRRVPAGTPRGSSTGASPDRPADRRTVIERVPVRRAPSPAGLSAPALGILRLGDKAYGKRRGWKPPSPARRPASDPDLIQAASPRSSSTASGLSARTPRPPRPGSAPGTTPTCAGRTTSTATHE